MFEEEGLEKEFEDFTMPENFEPLLADVQLCDQKTSFGVALFWAPTPFNRKSGRTRRAFDVPLV